MEKKETKMKVKVIKAFRDKHTGKLNKVGAKLNITKERYDEILKVGKFVEEIKADKKADEKKAEK